MEVNAGCMPTKRQKADSGRKNTAFFVFNGLWGGGFVRDSLTRRLGFGIIGRELYRSASGKV